LGLLQAGVGTAATDDATQRLLDNATRNTDRLIRLVNAMLDVERLAAGRMPMTFEPVDLLHVARGAAESLAAVADARGVTIDVTGEPVTVDADVDRMTQVALNLVDNALKFAPAGTAVRVSVHTSGDAAELAVADDGPGMAAEQAAVVFDRFVQLSHGGGTPAGGSGLGLAIVRGIVEQHDGAVRVDAAPGAGATFVVTLPLRQER
jgi:signal transduction histidine kinase